MSEIYSNQTSELIAHPQATSELLGAPSIFGNETSEYTACQFIAAFERCIKLNPVLMANHEFRLAYFGSKLRAAPQDWFSNLEELHDETLESWNSLCAAFKLQFSLTRSQWQTRFEMHEISQGQRLFFGDLSGEFFQQFLNSYICDTLVLKTINRKLSDLRAFVTVQIIINHLFEPFDL
jgi:hypothetical protein